MSILTPLAREVVIKTLSKLSDEQIEEIAKLITDECFRRIGVTLPALLAYLNDRPFSA